MKRISFVTAIFLLCATLLSAVDLGGKWKGSFELDGNNLPFILDLKTTGDKVTGTVTPATNPPTEIRDGKLEGSVLTFYFTTVYNGDPVRLNVKVLVGNDDMKVSMVTEDGGWSREFPVTKI
jgi:hypothetical protein